MPDAPHSAGPAQRENPLRDVADAAFIAAGLLILLAIAVATLQASWNKSSIWLPALFAVLAAGPFILVAVNIRRRGDAWAVGAASALGWITILTGVAVTLGGIISAGMYLLGVRGPIVYVLATITRVSSELKHFMPTTAYVVLAGVVGICVVLVRNTRRTRQDTPADERRSVKGAALVWAYAVGAIPLFAMLGNWNEQRRIAEEARRFSRSAETVVGIRTTLREIQACLFAYTTEHPYSGYPHGLDAIGPKGSQCFDSASVRALFVNARLRYLALSPDSGGHMREFWLVAEPMSHESSWNRQYYADEKGLVYYSDLRARDDSIAFNRPVPDSPLPPNPDLLEVVDSPVASLVRLQRCLAGPGSTPSYPHDLERTRCNIPYWRDEGGASALKVYSRFDERLPGGVYSIEYKATRPMSESAFAAYSISLRPMTYGEDGTRSYWSDELRRIHWTLEDRPANANDPVVGDCELVQSCK